MKIGIITLTGDNYGAILQAYALFTLLNNFGYETEIICYMDKHRVMSSLSLAGKFKHFVRHVFKLCITLNKKHRNFEKFRRGFIKWSAIKYKDSRMLKRNAPQYDVYITGSDQVWNPELYRYDLNYLLDFVPDGMFSFSYAASFGTGVLPEYAVENTKRLLGRLNAISVRESTGVDIVKSLGYEAKLVADPTLLLTRNDWSEMTKTYNGKYKGLKTVVCYVMPGDKEVCSAIVTVGKHMAKKLQIPLVILGARENKAFSRYYDVTAGPDDFIHILLNASFMVTNSFHGTCFSINFNIPFCYPVMEHAISDSTLNARALSLLKLTGMTDAVLPVSSKQLVNPDGIKTCFDFDRANSVIDNMRMESIRFINETIAAYHVQGSKQA